MEYMKVLELEGCISSGRHWELFATGFKNDDTTRSEATQSRNKITFYLSALLTATARSEHASEVGGHSCRMSNGRICGRSRDIDNTVENTQFETTAKVAAG